MRVHGPIGFEIAADQIEKGIAALALGNFHAIVDAADASAGFCNFAKLG